MLSIYREPPFCPAHNQQAPCLYCLTPEVGKIIEDRENSYHDKFGVLFQQADYQKN